MNSDNNNPTQASNTKTSSGVLSNLEIKEAYLNGQIVCIPFNEKHLSQASLDVTLGYYYYRIKNLDQRTIYNPFDQNDVNNYFDGPYKAQPYVKTA